jgi:hypothetical protein
MQRMIQSLQISQLLPSGTTTTTPVQSSHGSIYWYDICKKLDFFITEPCENLVTPDGYGLTSEGKHMAACIAGGGLLTLLDPSLQSLIAAQGFGKAVGCHTLLNDLGGRTRSSLLDGNNERLGEILGGMLGK